jgi:hypothetical protein
MSSTIPFWVYDDKVRGLALLRGRNVRAILELAGVTDRARWSIGGRGYVLAGDDVATVCAHAEIHGMPYRVKTVGGETPCPAPTRRES